MRQILIDYARAKATEKGGGDRVQVSLNPFRPGEVTGSTVGARVDDGMERFVSDLINLLFGAGSALAQQGVVEGQATDAASIPVFRGYSHFRTVTASIEEVF